MVARVERGKRVVKSQLSQDSGYPVYQNSLVAMGFHTEANYTAGITFVIGAGAAGEIGYSYEDFWAADDCFPIICDGELDSRYLYHILLWKKDVLSNKVRRASVPRLARTEIEDLMIPVPPMEIQKEIITLLDQYICSLDMLQKELQSEISNRSLQYKYYCKRFIETSAANELISIGDLGKWVGGMTPLTSNLDYWKDGDIPWVSSKDMKTASLIDTENHITKLAIEETTAKLLPKDIVAIVTRSGILKHTLPIVYIPINVAINQDIKALIPNESINARYILYVLKAFHDDLLAVTKKQGGTVDSIDIKKFFDFKIPIPSYEKQLQMVEQLTHLENVYIESDNLIKLEIQSRLKQFECYRNRLLSFEELK